MENFQTPAPVEWNNKLVLLTYQLAEYYECDVQNIKKNFNANKNRFVEGKHYFKIEGDLLNILRVTFSDLQISPKTRTLYLWTERGAARHAKMLSTDKAWEVFEILEDTYFNQNASPTPVVAKPVRVPNPNRVAAQLADASIYVVRVGEEYVKIGNSKNVEERKANLKSWRGLSFGEDYKTVCFPRTIARKIEKTCQQIFSPYHVEGEIFHVKYETARIAIKALEQFVEELPLISNPKFGDKLLKLAEMMGDTPERQALLLEAGNIFVGKKSV